MHLKQDNHKSLGILCDIKYIERFPSRYRFDLGLKINLRKKTQEYILFHRFQ